MKPAPFISLLFCLFILLGCSQTEKPASTETNSLDSKIFLEIMSGSADAWNSGNLEGHLSIYDSSATFMASKGLIGVAALKENFQKKYFNGAKPAQQLAFDEIQVKPLGNEYALVTGKFILTGGNQPEQSGRFSLVFGKTDKGWKVLHDHSS